jgi:hypothetical protein
LEGGRVYRSQAVERSEVMDKRERRARWGLKRVRR